MAALGIVNAINAALTAAKPPLKLDVTENHGRQRRSYDSFLIASADELALNDVIKMMKLPKGACIYDAMLSMPASGATGQVQIGWPVSSDGLQVADLDALYTSAQADPGNAAIDKLVLSSVQAGYNLKLAAEVQVQMTAVEVTADAGGDLWELEVHYTLD